jgi:hypothetical protein
MDKVLAPHFKDLEKIKEREGMLGLLLIPTFFEASLPMN